MSTNLIVHNEFVYCACLFENKHDVLEIVSDYSPVYTDSYGTVRVCCRHYGKWP